MANPLFDRSSLALLAENDQLVEYKGKISDFRRLSEIVEAEISNRSADPPPQNWRGEPVAIKLQFGWIGYDKTLPAVSGSASAKVAARCQRCLEWFELQLSTQLRLKFVAPASALDLGEDHADYDAWETNENTIIPAELVEECLLLAMPLAPAHDTDDCHVQRDECSEGEVAKLRPFADLKAQLAKQKIGETE